MVVAFIAVASLNSPSYAFPVDKDVVIRDGYTQSEIAQILSEEGVVKSALLFHITYTQFFESQFILAGTYRFSQPLTTYQVAQALAQGLYRTPTVRLTLPEGFSVKNFTTYLPPEYIPDSEFDLLPYEGYLFPDTYFISRNMKITDIVELLTKTMEERLAVYEDVIKESGFTPHEVIVLASIIEREANDEVSMRRVSGILQNRLRINMPLQVDATFDYILNKTSAQLTRSDLAIDSPFNTYTNTGLPPYAIANPGIMAIEAVLYPIQSEDFYYLTGDNGVFYYAETFDEHVRNKQRYLR